MPKKKLRPPPDRDALLALVPPGAKRIKVQDEFGKGKFKPIDELADTDIIMTKPDGGPIVMMANPGRRSKVVLAPANATVAKQLADKAAAVSADPILRAAQANPDSPDLIHALLVALGEEAASLGFIRSELERTGKFKDSPAVSARRITGLKTMAETWFRKIEFQRERSIDMESPGFQALAKLWLETFKEAMSASGCRPEVIDTVFAKFAQISSDPSWTNEAKTRIKSAV